MLRKKQLPTKSTVRVTVTLKKDNFNIQNNVKIKTNCNFSLCKSLFVQSGPCTKVSIM